MAITASGPASRMLRDNELRAVINALDTNGDKILQKDELNITQASLRQQLDKNHNGKFEAEEVKQGLLADKFTVSLTRTGAVQVLLKFDANQDGYLSKNELELNQAALNLVDNYGANKYSFVNGKPVFDANNNYRQTGVAAADGRVSISELANVLADQVLVIGQSLHLPKKN